MFHPAPRRKTSSATNAADSSGRIPSPWRPPSSTQSVGPRTNSGSARFSPLKSSTFTREFEKVQAAFRALDCSFTVLPASSLAWT